MQKNVTTTKVVVTDKQGNEYTADDAVKMGVGSAVLRQIHGKDTVVIAGDEDTTYIPWHNVAKAVVTTTSSEEEYTDDFCVEEGESE